MVIAFSEFRRRLEAKAAVRPRKTAASIQTRGHVRRPRLCRRLSHPPTRAARLSAPHADVVFVMTCTGLGDRRLRRRRAVVAHAPSPRTAVSAIRLPSLSQDPPAHPIGADATRCARLHRRREPGETRSRRRLGLLGLCASDWPPAILLRRIIRTAPQHWRGKYSG